MFYESRYPKKELAGIAKELEGYQKRFLRHENRLYKIEKACFIGFYFLRKLIESKYKISDYIREENIIVTSYPFNGKKRIFNPDGSDYNYDNPLKESINIKNLTHQFIHSQILFPIKAGRGLHSIMVTSDKMIYTKIYEIDVNDIIKIFKMVSNNYVDITLTYYDKNKEKVIIICE